ncbi:hypothetical protein DSUL_20210 [Desulfovibrionales bacterium]
MLGQACTKVYSRCQTARLSPPDNSKEYNGSVVFLAVAVVCNYIEHKYVNYIYFVVLV